MAGQLGTRLQCKLTSNSALEGSHVERENSLIAQGEYQGFLEDSHGGLSIQIQMEECSNHAPAGHYQIVLCRGWQVTHGAPPRVLVLEHCDTVSRECAHSTGTQVNPRQPSLFPAPITQPKATEGESSN